MTIPAMSGIPKNTNTLVAMSTIEIAISDADAGSMNEDRNEI